MNFPKLLVLFATFPLSAHAHVGHLGELAGHDHVVAGIAIGAAIVIGIAKAAKGRGSKEEEPEQELEPESSEGETA